MGQSVGAHKRIRAEGPQMWRRSAEVIALSMILHELATNAVKYGALSNETGVVSLTWVFEDGLIRLEWVERGGPPVAAPSRTGFGSKMMRRIVEAEDRATLDVS